ncbi:hypothetical protein DL98DRAFT_249320 [Cadophora sp. DSE1049]|nr:hypothetical protein DL98DRAFT_249320 [Cadophora sp. DSE1049]
MLLCPAVDWVVNPAHHSPLTSRARTRHVETLGTLGTSESSPFLYADVVVALSWSFKLSPFLERVSYSPKSRQCTASSHSPIVLKSFCLTIFYKFLERAPLPSSIFFVYPTFFYLLPSTYFLQPTSFNLLPSTYFLQPTSFNLLPSTYFLQPTPFKLPLYNLVSHSTTHHNIPTYYYPPS